MKPFTLFIAAVTVTCFAPVRRSQAAVEVTFDFFYDALDPNGDWVYSDDYGYCWSPAVARDDDGWRPYSSGYWAWTDGGWTWISDEDFGWATYHYGRWARLRDRWCWVPGYEWAPAWVSWRQTDEFIGWAPLPPEARWQQDAGFQTWTDSYYDIGPRWYNFVPVDRFSERRLQSHLLSPSRNFQIIDRSVNVTHITYRQDVVNNIFVGGPDRDRIEKLGGKKVSYFKLKRDDSFKVDNPGGRNARDHFRGLSRIDGDTLIVAAPKIRQGEVRAPSKVRERIDRDASDRGWGDTKEREVSGRLRDKFRKEADTAEQKKLPPKTEHPPLALPPPQTKEGTEDVPRPLEPKRPDEEKKPRKPDEKPDIKPRPPVPDRPDEVKPGLPRKPDQPKKPDTDNVKPLVPKPPDPDKKPEIKPRPAVPERPAPTPQKEPEADKKRPEPPKKETPEPGKQDPGDRKKDRKT